MAMAVEGETMSEYLTVVYRDLKSEESVRKLTENACRMSWSDVMAERDELRNKVERFKNWEKQIVDLVKENEDLKRPISFSEEDIDKIARRMLQIFLNTPINTYDNNE